MTGFTYKFVMAAAGMVLLAASSAFAQNEVGGSNLVVKKVYVKSHQGALASSLTPLAAFTPTVISCPGNGDCVVQMTVSAAMGVVLENQAIYVRLRVDGELAFPSVPGSEDVPFIEAWVFASEYKTTRSFTWIKEITPGTHTVTVDMYSSNANSYIGGRTLSVSVLK